MSERRLYTLLWEDDDGQYAIGYVPDCVVRELELAPVAVRGEMTVHHARRSLILFQLPAEAERSRAVAALVSYWRGKDSFKILRGWRNEVWPVYSRRGELLFSVERAALGLFGAMRYGVHLTAYVIDHTVPHGFRLWIPKRAVDKSTFPGMLDNTVAGGLMTGESPLDCIVREADEEASLPSHLVRQHALSVGTVTYIYVTEEKYVGQYGLIYPECQWIYDLELPAGIIPQPKDGEVQEFYLCDVNQVKSDLAAGKFKRNCALVVIDFFIRHGILMECDEPNLSTIKQRMHRQMPFPGPHQSDWHHSQ